MKKSLFYLFLFSFIGCLITNSIFSQPREIATAMGKISPNSENVNNEVDPVFASMSKATGTLNKIAQGIAENVSGIPQGMQIVTRIVDKMIQREYSFSLLSSHKYMVNDCLGLKVSSGQFDLKFSNPDIKVNPDGKISLKLGIDKIKFSALKVRSRPRAPDFSDPNPCHFSGKFEIGGEATDVSVKLTLDLVTTAMSGATTGYCYFAFDEPVKITWTIGGFNLKPVPNTLDNVAKEMVEDALNNGMTDLIYNRFIQASKEIIPEFYSACQSVYNNSKGLPDKISNAAESGTEKWTITPNNLKGATGRILMDNPAGSKWVVYIYAMADNKYITSAAESNNKGLFVIFPGEYKFTINNAPVLNVPVKKGYDTKLKCGTLDIVSEGIWYLYDETGKVYYTSGNEPGKMPLPVGTYSLKLGEASQTVVIKNGETVEM